jgi:signal transduction histidine kinase
VRADRPDPVVLDDLRSTLGSRPLDLVVTMGGLAAGFAQKHKAEIFPATPVLIAAVDSRFLDSGPLPVGTTAVTVRNDPLLMLESMLRLLPGLKTVVVVIGASQLERFWLREAQQMFRPFENRVTFIWTNELSAAELLERCSTLPAHSAILYGIWSLDAKGVPQVEDPTLDALHAAANAPMFGLYSYQLGHGILGGPLLSMEDVARDSAAVALGLLRGEPAPPIPPAPIVAGTPTFDWRELRRWGIAETRLEAGSIVRFREPPSTQGYTRAAVVAIVVAGALIALAVNLARRRQTAPGDLSELQSAEAALSALTQRLMQAREHERASTAKAINDDVAQQLAALTMHLHALGVETEGRAGQLRLRIEDLCGQFWELEREILAISDPVYRRITILGLAESARAFCERRCAEAGVALEFRDEGMPETLSESIALALFRVLEETVDNAIRHGRPSHLGVSLNATDSMIHLAVSDDGAGFDAAAAIKRGALGLIGMRERMRIVGGTWRIESRPGAGTRVDATAPVQGGGRG